MSNKVAIHAESKGKVPMSEAKRITPVNHLVFFSILITIVIIIFIVYVTIVILVSERKESRAGGGACQEIELPSDEKRRVKDVLCTIDDVEDAHGHD